MGNASITTLAVQLSAFLCEHLPHERKASLHACEAYAYAFQLVVSFAADRLGVRLSQHAVEQLDVPLILASLKHLKAERRCSARTCNARLAAIHSFFRFLQYRLTSCLGQARQIDANLLKRPNQALICYPNYDKLRALPALNPGFASGLRDYAMLHLAFTAGLRISELVGLRLDQRRNSTVVGGVRYLGFPTVVRGMR